MNKPDEIENLRILLVEDESQLRATLESMLRELSFEVDAVGDSGTALARLREAVYDILLTDLRLPGNASGEEIVCQAKELYPDLIAIVMTGFGLHISRQTSARMPQRSSWRVCSKIIIGRTSKPSRKRSQRIQVRRRKAAISDLHSSTVRW